MSAIEKVALSPKHGEVFPLHKADAIIKENFTWKRMHNEG
jgi:hypothetical protein